MPEPYGSFAWICAHAPLPVCNIIFQAAWDSGDLTALLPPTSMFFALYNITSTTLTSDLYALAACRAAGSGLSASCVISHAGQHGSVGDIPLVVMSVFSVAVSLGLVFRSFRNKNGVGATELSLVLITFALHSSLQAITQSSMLLQGSLALLILSAVHLAVIATLGWLLLCNIMVLWRSYDDRKRLYIGILGIGSPATFGETLYIALATGFRWTNAFVYEPQIRSIALFTLTLVWPAIALIATFGTMFYIAEYRMDESEPARDTILITRLTAVWLLGSAAALAAGQAVLFLASQPLCRVMRNVINDAFIAALMGLLVLVLFYRVWNNMGEARWSLTEAWMPRYSYGAYRY